MTPREQELHKSRQSVYGPWRDNMAASSDQINGLVRQWQANNPDSPLPAWIAPLCQVAVKMNRIASGRFHADNFDDLRVYLAFVEEMQRGTPPEPAVTRTAVHGEDAWTRVERIYVAGPYSAPTQGRVQENVYKAASAAAAIMSKGHDAHCPHSATHLPSLVAPGLGYARWLRLDKGILERWATGICVIGRSPGVEEELELAKSLGKTIYEDVKDIPDIT